MSESIFSIGQRWVSNSESELGLGIITQNSGRTVELLFPASDEQRTYAVNIAPLSRVQYAVGEQVKTKDGQSFTIAERHEINQCFIYQGQDEAGEQYSIHEMDLDSFVQFSQPQDRLFAGQIDKNRQFELRIEALAHQHRLQHTAIYGLMGPRVQLLPHQMYIAYQVANRHAPRVLLADEVGLGKTIEAGLIIHQQLMTGRASRVLIVVPDSLIHQWLVEMLRRFNLSFSILDQERHEALLEAGEANSFDSSQLQLCSLSTLTQHPEIYQHAASSEWDLMVVDEAHHLHWSEQEVSPAYRCIEGLATQVAGLLLLTATPEQLGVESHFARLRLLDPDRYFDLKLFNQQETEYQSIAALVEQLSTVTSVEGVTPLEKPIKQYLGEASYSELVSANDLEQQCNEAINTLLDQHGTGRILFRNTRDVIKGFPKRILNEYPLQAPNAYIDAAADANVDGRLKAELLLGDDWLAKDSRLSWLVSWLQQYKNDKVLLICAEAETAQSLELYLRIQQGMRSTVFHEGMSLVHRDRASAYFADDEEGAMIMLCSEIGSEGRNFQFAHHLVLFDLPLNPDLLEQRIGRLDRIGQQYDVHLHVPYYEQTAQAVLLKWYHQGMNAFERVFSAGSEIKAQVLPLLNGCLDSPDNSKLIGELIEETQSVTVEILSKLEGGRNKLLERNSCDINVAMDLIEQLEYDSQSFELSKFMDNVFDQYGVEQQMHSADSIIISPSEHMLEHEFPALPNEGITATYKRHRALVREDMAFLNWEHPMVSGSLDLVINGDIGNNAFCTLKDNTFNVGALLLEAIYTVHCPAPKALQVNRYLSQGYLRIVSDEKGDDYSEQLDEVYFNTLSGRIPKPTAQEMVRHARDNINQLLKQSKAIVQRQQAVIVDDALANMRQHMDKEISRLTELAKVNPSIREEEIAYLENNKTVLEKHLKNSQLSLNAIRVAITVEGK